MSILGLQAFSEIDGSAEVVACNGTVIGQIVVQLEEHMITE